MDLSLNELVCTPPTNLCASVRRPTPSYDNDQAFVDLCAILQEREPLYRQAQVVVETSGRSVDEVSAELEERLGSEMSSESAL